MTAKITKKEIRVNNRCQVKQLISTKLPNLNVAMIDWLHTLISTMIDEKVQCSHKYNLYNDKLLLWKILLV